MGWVDPWFGLGNWVGLGRDFSVFGGLGWVTQNGPMDNSGIDIVCDLVVEALWYADVCSVGDRLSVFQDVENHDVETLRHDRRHVQTDCEAVDRLTRCNPSVQAGPHSTSLYSTRSTQPCIHPGSLNRVPASAGVKARMSPLQGGR